MRLNEDENSMRNKNFSKADKIPFSWRQADGKSALIP